VVSPALATAAGATRVRAPLRSTSVSASYLTGELNDVILGHGAPLLRWRSGGLDTHDTPPYSFLPSLAFAYS
jgi:hypothetical protein